MDFIKLENDKLNKHDLKGIDYKEIYALKKNECVVGIASINNIIKGENEVYICVASIYQGNGYGSILFKNIIDILKTNGKKKIELSLKKDNYKMCRIIEKQSGVQISTKGNFVSYVVPIK